MLIPEGPRIHGFKMANLSEHIVKSTIQMGPNLCHGINACVGQKINRIGHVKRLHMAYSKLKKT